MFKKKRFKQGFRERKSPVRLGLKGLSVAALSMLGRWPDDIGVAGLTIAGRWFVDMVVSLTIQRVAGLTIFPKAKHNRAKGRWSDDIVFYFAM